jgi:hypothetical protein
MKRTGMSAWDVSVQLIRARPRRNATLRRKVLAGQLRNAYVRDGVPLEHLLRLMPPAGTSPDNLTATAATAVAADGSGSMPIAATAGSYQRLSSQSPSSGSRPNAPASSAGHGPLAAPAPSGIGVAGFGAAAAAAAARTNEPGGAACFSAAAPAATVAASSCLLADAAESLAMLSGAGRGLGGAGRAVPPGPPHHPSRDEHMDVEAAAAGGDVGGGCAEGGCVAAVQVSALDSLCWALSLLSWGGGEKPPRWQGLVEAKVRALTPNPARAPSAGVSDGGWDQG